MNIAIQLPANSCEILNSVWSDAVDVDMFHAVFGLLIYDYYFMVKQAATTPQLDMFGQPPQQVTQTDIAEELYEINLSECGHDCSKAEFVKAALDWYRVVIPYTDIALQQYSYLDLIDVSINEHYDDHRENFQTYVFLKFSQ